MIKHTENPLHTTSFEHFHNSLFSKIIAILLLITFLIVLTVALLFDGAIMHIISFIMFLFMAALGFVYLVLLALNKPHHFIESDKIDLTFADYLDEAVILTDIHGNIFQSNSLFKTIAQKNSSENLIDIFAFYKKDEILFSKLLNMAKTENFIVETFLTEKPFFDKHQTAQSLYYKLSVKAYERNYKKYLLWRLENVNLDYQNKFNTITSSNAPIIENLDLGVFTYYMKECPTALATMDKNGEILNANKAFSKLFQLGNKDYKTTKLQNLIHNSDISRLNKAIENIENNERNLQCIETHIAEPSKNHIQLYFNKIPFQNNHHISDSITLLTAIEITEKKSIEDKMVHGQKMQAIGQLAGGIAHDFNNVLTAILMSCDLLLVSHRSSDPAHADLMNIKHNANRAAALVQQLLAFSRRQTLQPEVVDLTDLLSDIRNLLNPLLNSNIILKIIHGRDLWPVEIDQASFQRVLMNLVINARDAMPNGGNITITTNNLPISNSALLNYEGFVAGDYIELRVEDNGTGIEKSVQEKMFEPFFTTKEVGKGTGLGLSMVYGIIKQSGGYIYCDSVEGKGTCFRMFLPRFLEKKSLETHNDIQNEIHKEPTKQSDKNTDLSGFANVLLVEDEDAVRMGSVRALKSRGYNVFEAGNGLEALDILEEQQGKIDIVVSDVVMPEMDGPTLLGELRKQYPDIKFIFVSGYAKDAFAKNLPEDAVFGFLSKPFTLKQLALKVKETLEQE